MDIASTTEVGVEYIEYTGEVASINWDNATKAAATEKVTPWTVMITGLTADKQYAVRAYATTATGKIYGSIITFIATAPEPISIADLVTKIKATTTETPIDKDYVIQGIICGDPQSKNCSFGTLYLMTKGATTAGNAVTVYNTDIASETYSLGDEIKVILRKENTKMQVYNSSPQVSGFDPAEIEKISSNNEVIPVETTVDQLLDFVCMPVTIKNVTIEQAGTWKQEENKYVTHKFKVSGADLTVYINKGAEIFKDKPFAAKTGSITGIAAAYKTDAQILPRNLDDVKDFEITGPTIISVTPKSLSLPATGGSEELIVEVMNFEGKTLNAKGLSGILKAEVNGTKVTVTASANPNNTAESQTLILSVDDGNKVEVPVRVEGKPSGNETIITLDLTNKDNYPEGFPTSKTEEEKSYTFGGYTYTFKGTTGAGYYFQATSKYLMLGKTGAYIELPAIPDKKLTKITLTTRDGASKKVTVGIVDTNDAIVIGGDNKLWNQDGGNIVYTYDLSESLVNTKYRIKVTNSNNIQLVKWEFVYK